MSNATSGADFAPIVTDLSTCDMEPIRIPGAIQPHGAMLIARPETFEIVSVSANTETLLGKAPDRLLGALLSTVVPEGQLIRLQAMMASGGIEGNPTHLLVFSRSGHSTFNVICHTHAGLLFVEFEPGSAEMVEAMATQAFYPGVRTALTELESANDIATLHNLAAEAIRRFSGFDRVMVYQFDEDWHGHVVGESRAADVETYMQHHFPASDIPAQARELYRSNRSRVIVDAAYNPVPLLGRPHADGTPVDMTYSILRSVSPIHAEYLRNMGAYASTSFSIMQDGRLWGLIACHHRRPHGVAFQTRVACEFVCQVFSLQISSQSERLRYQHRMRLQASQNRLLTAMANEDGLVNSLARASPQLLQFMEASGAAVYFEKKLTLLGATPNELQVQAILNYLISSESRDVFATDSLVAHLPDAEQFKATGCGMLSICVSRFANSYILWFRPERIRTVNWGGNPYKPVEPTEPGAKISPRKSFENWKQIVENHSVDWLPEELEVAAEFRMAIVNIVLRKLEEVADISTELRRANSELEAFSYSVSHDLRAPFRHIAGFCDLLQRRVGDQIDDTSKRYVKTISDAARHAGALVDALLAFSRVARVEMQRIPVALSGLVLDVRSDLEEELRRRNIEWRISELPSYTGDPTLLRLVFQNLISNAVKFTRDRSLAVIEIFGQIEDGAVVIVVQDNGAGFEANYAEKLFMPFQRLHDAEEFEGTGIGLANVKRIVERHGGSVRAEGAVGKGARFTITLPLQERVT